MGITEGIGMTRLLGTRERWKRGQGLEQLAFRSWQTTFLLVAVPTQRPKPEALTIYRNEQVDLPGQEAWLAIMLDLEPQSKSHTDHRACFTVHLERETHLQSLKTNVTSSLVHSESIDREL